MQVGVYPSSVAHVARPQEAMGRKRPMPPVSGALPRLRWSLAPIIVLGVCAVAHADMLAQDPKSAVTTSAAEAVRGGGRWRLDGAGAQREALGAAERSWTLTALRTAEGELRGRVSLSGVAALAGANVEARLSGRGVVGTLRDDDGRVLATFEGAVGAAGAAGTFVHLGGGTGTWTWDGPAADGATSAGAE